MKIEIIPEGKRAKREKGSEAGEWPFQWILDMLLGTVQSFVDGVTESVTESVKSAMSQVMQKTVIFFLLLVGMFFLLGGFAQILSVFYQLPGMGEVVVGFLTLMMALLFSVIWKK
jgi:hypothetical protein